MTEEQRVTLTIGNETFDVGAVPTFDPDLNDGPCPALDRVEQLDPPPAIGVALHIGSKSRLFGTLIGSRKLTPIGSSPSMAERSSLRSPITRSPSRPPAPSVPFAAASA